MPSTSATQPGPRGCHGRRKDGQPCGGPAITGTTHCKMHAGVTLAQAKAKGAVVTTIRRWGLDDQAEDPGLLLLKLLTVTEWNRQGYEGEIDRILAEAGETSLSEALVGDSIVVDKDGSPHKVGEYIRGIVQLEAQERKLAAELSIKALAAGVAERLARLEEQRAELVVDVLRAVLGDLGHSMADERVQRVLAERLTPLAVTA